MVMLGVGKNMAKSLRFWAGAFGLVEDTAAPSVRLTAFADWLLNTDDGADPYLEDPRSLWLLHWRVTATAHLGAWRLVFFDTPESEVLKSRVRDRLAQRAALAGKRLAPNTLRQHVDVFLSCYAPRALKSANTVEEALACPLQELGLVSLRPSGNADEVIDLARAERPSVDELTFARLVWDYWRLRARHDRTLTMSSLLLDYGSPGLVLRMEETGLAHWLDAMTAAFPLAFRYSHGIERQTLSVVPDDFDRVTAMLEYV